MSKIDEIQRLKDAVNKIVDERQQAKADLLNNTALPLSKKIIDANFQFDNSEEGSELIRKGIRRNIYKKDDIYYLGYYNVSGRIEFYCPRKSYSEIEAEFHKANSH